MDDAAAWLEANAVECDRYHAWLSPTGCRQHQVLDPEACKGCSRQTEAGVTGWAAASRRAQRVHQIKQERRRPVASKRGTCATCERPDITLVSKDRCGRCYDRIRKGKDPLTGQPVGEGVTQEATVQAKPEPPAPQPQDERPQAYATLRLDFDADDVPLLEALEEDARANRRSADQHLLWILERVLELGTQALQRRAA